MNRIKKFLKCSIVCLCLFYLIVEAHAPFFSSHNRGIFYFTPSKGGNVLLNNENLVPPFHSNTDHYNLITLNTFYPNVITYGNQKKHLILSEIQPEDFILLFIGFKQYRINLYDTKTIPTYQVTAKNVSPGFFFLTPFNGENCFKSYAFIVDEKGGLRYYRRNTQEEKCVSDFKKNVLPNGKIRFTLMEQEKPMPPTSYHSGHLLVLDEKFQILKTLKLLPHNTHAALGAENHESVYFDDNHYILSAYYETEVYDKDDNPIKIAAPIVQEIRDDKVVFEFNASDYPDLLETSWITKPDKGYWDYMHYNSLAIDPKDGNWILSFANQSSLIKINRQEQGKIMWIMGGKANMFNLKPEEFFSFQHKPVFRNGYMILFDNNLKFGKKFSPPNEKKADKSYLLKFKIDEDNLKLTDFKQIPIHFTYSMGNAFETEENSFVYSAGSNSRESCVEITPQQETLFRLSLTSPLSTYRCYKYHTVNGPD